MIPMKVRKAGRSSLQIRENADILLGRGDDFCAQLFGRLLLRGKKDSLQKTDENAEIFAKKRALCGRRHKISIRYSV